MNFWELLNGNVPGGITLLLILMAVFTGTWFFIVRLSPVMTIRHFIRVAIIVNVLFIVGYGVIWKSHPPVIPEDRLVIGPFSCENEEHAFIADEIIHRIINLSTVSNLYITDYRCLLPSLSAAEKKARLRLYTSLLSSFPADFRLEGTIGKEGGILVLNLKLVKNKNVAFSKKIMLDSKAVDELGVVLKKIPGLLPQKASSTVEENYLKNFINNEMLLHNGNYAGLINLKECVWDTIQWAGRLNKEAWEIRKKEKKRNPLLPNVTASDKLFGKARNRLIKLAQADRLPRDGMLTLAENYILNEKFGHADAVLKQLMTLNINDYRIYYLLSFLHPSRLQEIKLRDELDALQRAYIICPLDERVLFRYADFLFKKSNPSSTDIERSIGMVQTWISKNPGSLKAYLKLGWFYMYLNRLDDAQRIYAQADSLFPGNEDILMNRAILAKDRRQFKKAIQIFRRLKDKPDFEDVYLYMGDIYLQTEKFDSALMMFRKRVDLKKGDNDKLYGEALKGIRRALQMKEEANGR